MLLLLCSLFFLLNIILIKNDSQQYLNSNILQSCNVINGQQSSNRSVPPCSAVTWRSLRSVVCARQIQKNCLRVLPAPYGRGTLAIFLCYCLGSEKICCFYFCVFLTAHTPSLARAQFATRFLCGAKRWWLMLRLLFALAAVAGGAPRTLTPPPPPRLGHSTQSP